MFKYCIHVIRGIRYSKEKYAVAVERRYIKCFCLTPGPLVQELTELHT